MTVLPTHRPRRLAALPDLGVDAAARAAGSDPRVLRLENLDTDVPPPPAVLAATRESVGRDEANSYLPFNGLAELREAVAGRLHRDTGVAYDPEQDVVITCGGTEGLFDALLATVEEGDDWRLDLQALHDAVTDRTRALFVMNPSMPSGAVLEREEWEAIGAVCRDRGCWLIYNA